MLPAQYPSRIHASTIYGLARSWRYRHPTFMSWSRPLAVYYEPDLNRTYLEMAQFYDVAVMPACPYRSRDVLERT